MLKKWLLYIASIFLALFLSIMYYEPFPVLLLLMIIIVPIIGILVQLPLLWNITIKFSTFAVVCEVGEESKVEFLVKNRSFIPAFKLRIYLKTENELSGQKQIKYVDMRVPAYDEIIVPLYIYSEDCGRIHLTLEKVHIMGIIPIYYWMFPKSEKQKSVYMTVLPRMKTLSMTISSQTRNSYVDWELLKIKKEDNSIYRIRPFQPIDKLQRVHWKLSAKNDEWMVREILTRDGANVLLVMDWTEHSAKILNRTMEVMVSLALGLSLESCNAVIASSNNIGDWYSLSSEEDLYLIFGEIMQQKIESNKNQLPFLSILEQKCVGVAFPHIYYVTDSIDENIINLLGTTNIAHKKTFIYTGEKSWKHLEILLQQYKIEYFCMEKDSEDSMSQWDFIV